MEWLETDGYQFVTWMQQGRICIFSKILFSVDLENTGKNSQFKI